MKENDVRPTTYKCQLADKCTLKKHCHILKTAAPLTEPVPVLFLCPEAGKDENGKKRERVIVVGGKAA